MYKFQEYYNKLVQEDMISGVGGVFGDYNPSFNPPVSINSADTYAPGDARKPNSLGIQRRPNLNTKRGRKKRKTKSNKPGPLDPKD
jgi:hypothetical protein